MSDLSASNDKIETSLQVSNNVVQSGLNGDVAEVENSEDKIVSWIEEADGQNHYGATAVEISTINDNDVDSTDQSEKVTVIVVHNDAESANFQEESRATEINVEIDEAPKSAEVHIQLNTSNSESLQQDIQIIEEQPSKNCDRVESSDLRHDIDITLTEDDQEKLQDIYKDLFKGATISEREENKEDSAEQTAQEEDEQAPRPKCTCRCDCDLLLRAVECNYKVIGSKFCICGRRRRRQQQQQQQQQRQQQQQQQQKQTTTQQPIQIAVVNPVVVPPNEQAAEINSGVVEDEHPKAEDQKALEVHDCLVTPTTQRARQQGWSYYSKYAFPLVSDIVRDFWVFGELSLLVLSLILSLVFFALDERNRKGFNIFHLILTIIASILALIDAVFQLKDCKSCKAAINCHKNVKASRELHKYDVDCIDENESKEEPKENDSETSSHNDSTEDETKTKCQTQAEKFKDTLDIIRTLATEAIFYPLLICDLFEFITGKGYQVSNATDRLSLVLFLLSCIGIFLYVYVARMFVLCTVIIHVHKKRKGMRRNQNDPTGLYIQVYFAIHVFMQMVAQIFMIIAIAAKISYENTNYNPDDAQCESDNPPNDVCFTSASPRLWYMFISAYILPICGLLTFYIVCYYWITELPITVVLDFLRFLEAGSCDSFLSPKESTKEHIKKGKTLLKHYHDSIWRDFEKIYNVKFLNKLVYPFKNPMVIVLSITYAAFQFAFVVCAGLSGVAASEDVATTVILNEGQGWTIFFFIAALLGALANAYTFFIAYFWVLIITVVIFLLLLYILCVLCELCTIVDDCMKCNDIPTPGRIRHAFGV